MKITSMTATFGKLNKATLTPGEGFTLIQMDNEGGKSTWAAFLRAMLYGFPPRDRDKAGYIAEKNRYQPWSGAPMEGTIQLIWQGREVTLYRGPKGTIPWGTFTAVWTATGESVDALTAENCGEMLTGVSREVFERTAFVGQGSVALSPSGDLEKRVAALATSGEEDVSFSQVERRLKDWVNRRRSNSKNGIIPKLEGELLEVESLRRRQEDTLRQAQGALGEREALEEERASLTARLKAHSAAAQAQQAQRRQQAQADLDAARAALEQARRAADALPSADELRQAQGELSLANSLALRLRAAEKALPDALMAAAEARQKAEADPYFAPLDPPQAAAKAQSDHDRVERLTRKFPSLLSLLGAPVGAAVGTALYRALHGQVYQLPILLAGALAGWALVALPLLLMKRGRDRQAKAILARYEVQTPEEILTRAAHYNALWETARTIGQAAQTVEDERDRLAGQKAEVTGGLLHFVHSFAPEVTDLFGVSAALSRALQQGEQLSLARARLEGAEKTLAAIPEGEGGEAPLPLSTLSPGGNAGEDAARLSAVESGLRQVSDRHARLMGELNSLADPAELAARRSALTDELEKRRGELEALNVALEALSEADSLLRERFSPAVNQRAGEYLSVLTGGKYHSAALTRQFQALAREAGEAAQRQDLSLSGGAAQQLYLAARLAMCELALPGTDPCPILLDDTLDSFDDHRAKLALDCLLKVAETRQVLLFSCHSREGAMLAGTGAKVIGQTAPRG